MSKSAGEAFADRSHPVHGAGALPVPLVCELMVMFETFFKFNVLVLF